MSVHHGNTEKIARVIGDVLEADLAEPDEVDKSVISKYDLIGFGSGTYFGKHHPSLFRFVNSLPNQNGKAEFIFSISGKYSVSTRFQQAS